MKLLVYNERNEIFEKQNNDYISLYMCHSHVINLGPGKRFGIWVQGCLKSCADCMAPDAQDRNSGITKDCDDLVSEILSAPDIEGITISGGEPLLQWGALHNILSQVKQKSPDLNVLLYTGYLFADELWPHLDPTNSLYNPEFAMFFNMLDWWIDGPYDSKRDDERGFRGSSNQNLYGNIIHPKLGRKIISKKIDTNQWEALRGVPFFLEDDVMTEFATQERLPVWETKNGNATAVGIPTKNQLRAFY